MKRNDMIKELIESSGVHEQLIREFTRTESFNLLNDIMNRRRSVQVTLDYDDIELCFQNSKFIESYNETYLRPKRFTKYFWKKLSRFLFNATLYARSGIFLIETGSPLSERELSMIAEFYSEFSERFLQEADFFVGIGIKVTPQLKGNIRFHAMSFYPKTTMLCESCYQKVGKYLVSNDNEHLNLCQKCSLQEHKSKKRETRKATRK